MLDKSSRGLGNLGSSIALSLLQLWTPIDLDNLTSKEKTEICGTQF